MTTNADLRRLAQRYNRCYFHNSLPPIDVRFARIDPGCLGTCLMFSGVAEIRIAKETRRFPNIAKMTLLHELVHASLPPTVQHGPRFESEMLRLARAGAFRGLW
jgi:hypothetical protein